MMKSTKSFAAVAALAVCGTLLLPVLTRADEGMWTFDNPPLRLLQEKYHFTPTQQWLDHVRLSCVRLNDGGSGSFVSPNGLLLTNHHVARGQLQKNSTKEHDYIRDGFYAATPEQEMKSPDLEVNVLLSMENVTARVAAAVKNANTPEAQFAARKAAIAATERESQQSTGLRSDVVPLYQGGEYWLYRYKKYTDVRLVFAPEEQAAFFGGDPDNFTYPRYDMDLALFRVYENGKPIQSKDYLKWNPKGAGDNELVFVAGHPGSTSRLDTMAQLEMERDLVEPTVIQSHKERIAAVKEYGAQGPDQAREGDTLIFGMENSLKAFLGRYQGLLDKNVMAKKQREEEEFRSKVMANPEWRAAYGNAWSDIAEAEKKAASRFRQNFFETLNSQLGSLGANIVDYVAEIRKPDAERLPGYHDAQLDSLKFRLLSPAPIYKGLEMARMVCALKQLQAALGPNDPFLKLVLAGRTPEQTAQELVNGTKLGDAAFRKQLVDGGEAAVSASTDPLVVLERKLDPMRRDAIKWNEDNV
jgi:hypothetical protein